MKATVSIELQDLDNLRAELERSKARIFELENQKDFKITFDAEIYSWSDDNHNRKYDSTAKIYGNYDSLKLADNWKDAQEVARSCFQKMIEDSRPAKFYKKFPKWVHKLLLD